MLFDLNFDHKFYFILFILSDRTQVSFTIVMIFSIVILKKIEKTTHNQSIDKQHQQRQDSNNKNKINKLKYYRLQHVTRQSELACSQGTHPENPPNKWIPVRQKIGLK